MTHATYFDARVIQQEGDYPKVTLVADVTLLNTHKVKSIDLEAIKQAIERVLDWEAVNYVGEFKVEPPVSENGSGRD